MLILSKKVGCSPEVKNISDKSDMLKTLQESVKGFIESVSFHTEAGNFAVICNEEGRLMGLPYNCIIEGVDFVGDIVIAGIGADDFTDIPDGVVRYLQRAI